MEFDSINLGDPEKQKAKQEAEDAHEGAKSKETNDVTYKERVTILIKTLQGYGFYQTLMDTLAHSTPPQSSADVRDNHKLN
jgi:hypothetical protein